MKAIITLFIIFIIIPFEIFSQCGLTESYREDGMKIYSSAPKPIGHNNKNLQVGAFLQSNDKYDFLALVIRFKDKAKLVKSNLSITLENSNKLTLNLFKAKFDYDRGSNLCNAIYQLSETDYKVLGQSNIKSLKIIFDDNSIENIIISLNSDCIKKVITCLNSNKNGNTNQSKKETSIAKSNDSKSKISELDKKNGFKEYTLGKSIQEINLNSFSIIKKYESDGETTYEQKKPELTINDVPIERILLGFTDNKLSSITLDFHNGEKVSELLKETFGKPQMTMYSELNKLYKERKFSLLFFSTIYWWKSKNVRLIYSGTDYNQNFIYSESINLNNFKEYSISYTEKNYYENKATQRKQKLKSKKDDL